MNNYCLLCILYLLKGGMGLAQDNTRITLLGTVHRETTNFTKKDLFTIIEKVNPDLILFELDSSLIGKDFMLTGPFLKAFEGMVVDSFLRKHPHTLLRPFDIEGRNQFFIKTNFFQQEYDMFMRINELDRKDSLSKESKKIIQAAVEFFKLVDAFSKSSPEIINRDETDRVVEAKMNWYHQNYPALIAHSPALHPFIEHMTTDSTFWQQRNYQMANHIIQFADLFKGKKILVITGHYHRYFLKALLKSKEEAHGFQVKEYYEN